MTLDEATTAIRQRLASAGGFRHSAKFDFGDDGVVLVDGTVAPPAISHEDGEAEVTLACSLSIFQAILDGTQDPTLAFMMGKLKVRGSMGLAMKINGILEA